MTAKKEKTKPQSVNLILQPPRQLDRCVVTTGGIKLGQKTLLFEKRYVAVCMRDLSCCILRKFGAIDEFVLKQRALNLELI